MAEISRLRVTPAARVTIQEARQQRTLHRGLCLAVCLGLALSACYQPLQIDRVSRATPLLEALEAGSQQAPGALETSNQNSAEISIEQAVQLALANAPEVGAARAAESAALHMADQAGQVDNPFLRIDNVELPDLVDARAGLNLALRVPLHRPSELDAASAAGMARYRGVQAEGARIVREITGQVRADYRAVQYLQLDLGLARRALKLCVERLTLAEQGIERGTVTQLQRYQSEQLLVEARQDVRSIERELGDRMAGLADQVGVGSGGALRVTAVDTVQVLAGEIAADDVLVQRAIGSDPELRGAAAGMEEADAVVITERSQSWPWFRYGQLGYDFAGDQPAGLGFSALVAIDLPIFQINSAGVDAAQALVAQRAHEFDARVREVWRAVREARRGVVSARDALEAFEAGTLSVAHEAQAVAAESVAAGQSERLQQLLVALDGVLAERERLDLTRRYHRALERLAVLTASAGE